MISTNLLSDVLKVVSKFAQGLGVFVLQLKVPNGISHGSALQQQTVSNQSNEEDT